MTLIPYVVVFVGAGTGGVLRHLANIAGTALLGTAFPWSTLIVNVSGGLAMGLLAGWLAFRAQSMDQTLRLFLITGLLGGYTTFSAFTFETMALWERGQTWAAMLYVLASVGLSLLGLVAGLAALRP
jgi:CrcB protein